MKKRLLAVAAVCAAACCFAACDSKPDRYDELNSKLKSNYSGIDLTVTEKYDENTSLKSNYYLSLSGDTVNITYTIERFAGVAIDEYPPDDVKVTEEGKVIVINGVVVSGDLDVSDVLPDGFDFKEEYFENTELTGFSFEADVKDAAGFLGTEITCTDMKVSASFRNAFNRMTITYKNESGNSVEYSYKFWS